MKHKIEAVAFVSAVRDNGSGFQPQYHRNKTQGQILTSDDLMFSIDILMLGP